MSHSTNIPKIVMRRVYYAFAIRLATHPVTLYALTALALVWWLKELVFVARIWQSFVATPIGELGSFTLELLARADSLTLVVFAVTCVVAVQFARNLNQLRTPTMLLA
jgi:hypothetical protein